MLRNHYIGTSVLCKSFSILFILFLFIITGCNQEPKHEHTFSEEWSYDETSHWHASTCGHEAKGSIAPHVYGQGTSLGEGKTAYECQVCHATKIDYDIGSRGPAGGIVFYDCDADNDETNDGAGADGLRSSVCGWRYLEAAPYDLFLIDGWKPSVDAEDPEYCEGNEFFYYGYWDGSTNCDARGKEIGTGFSNTNNCWNEMKDSFVSYTKDNIAGDHSYITHSHFGVEFDWTEGTSLYPLEHYPILECLDLEYNGYGDWFLPSIEEMSCLEVVLSGKGNNALFGNGSYWTSTFTDYGGGWDNNYYYVFSMEDGNILKNNIVSEVGRIRPIRAFFDSGESCVHDFVDTVISDPTCTKYGCSRRTCIKCGLSYTYRSLKPLGHEYEMQLGQITHCETCNEIIYGPAGGYIFYDCDADNDSGNADGLISSECGWKYLEVTPVVYQISPYESFYFGSYRTSPNGKSMYSNGSLFYSEGTSDPNDGNCTGTAIGTGKANTIKLIAAMGDTAYIENGNTTSQYIAKLFDEYEINGFSDWFLPSRDEMLELYRYYVSINNTELTDYFLAIYCSSSESEKNRDEFYVIEHGAIIWSEPKDASISISYIFAPIRFVEGD